MLETSQIPEKGTMSPYPGEMGNEIDHVDPVMALFKSMPYFHT